MSRRASRPCNFFKKLVVGGVNRSKATLQNNCLTKLYNADAELKSISNELDSFDGKKDPQRCSLLVNQLRTAQDKVINLLFQLMDECNCERAPRDYRMKFPDEILLAEGPESLNGQIWFGAECLSAGSNILNHNKESNMLRPMAKTLTSCLDSLRTDLRELIIDGDTIGRIGHNLCKKMSSFDHIFATFEYEYVRTMLPIRTASEIEKLQEVAVLFSEALIDSVKRDLIKQDDIDEYQPIVMIALPRLAIVRGLLYDDENPVYRVNKHHMSSLFKPFHGPLHSIRKLLRALKPKDLCILETMLARNDSSVSGQRRSSSASDYPDETTDENQSANPISLTEPSTSAPSPSTSSPPTATPQDPQIDELLLRQSQQLRHRLFVAISGVADQLQSNFASDLRFILRQVFNTSDADDDGSNNQNDDDDEDDDDVEDTGTSDSDCDGRSCDDDQRLNDHLNDEAADNQPIEEAIEAREVADLIDFDAYAPRIRIGTNIDRINSRQGTTVDDLLSDSDANNSGDRSDGRDLVGRNLITASRNHHHADSSFNFGRNSADGQNTSSERTPPLVVIPHSASSHIVGVSGATSSIHHHHHDRNASSGPVAAGAFNDRHHHHHHHHHHRHHQPVAPAPRNPPIWVPDQLVHSCTFCNSSFSFFKRRHHCRDCGQIFCGECSKYTKNLQSLGYTDPQRVCVSCFQSN